MQFLSRLQAAVHDHDRHRIYVLLVPVDLTQVASVAVAAVYISALRLTQDLVVVDHRWGM